MVNLRILSVGLLISFLGSLPLGTMNVTATHIAVKEGLYAALVYSLGSMVIEIIYVYIVLLAMNWVNRQRKVFRLFEWITLLLLFVLSIASFVAAINMRGFDSALPSTIKYPFLLGVLLSATNPLHIIFWLGWSTFLLNKKILLPQFKNQNFYVVGIGMGTLLGFGVFVFGGSYFTKQIKANQNAINWTIGIILMATALIQLYKMKVLFPWMRFRNA